MTPEQALQIVDSYLANLAVNRAQHNQMMTAVGVLNNLIQKDKQQAQATKAAEVAKKAVEPAKEKK